MSPVAKFNALLASTTVSIMFFVIVALAPILRGASDYVPFLGVVAGFLVSAGTYRILAIVLRWMMGRSHRVRALVLGPSYMYGTWIGWFRGHSGELRLMVEHFNQDLDSLVITGHSFHLDGSDHGQWHSDAVSLDAPTGRLTFTYAFDTFSRSRSLAGVHNSLFERKSPSEPPYAYKGLAHDLNDTTRIGVYSEKLSNDFISSKDAFASAVRKYSKC
jgi:hypothetical protein